MGQLIHADAGLVTTARIEYGHWLADCPNPHCDSAMRLEYGSGYVCDGLGGCGQAAAVDWPAPADAQAIVRLLALRPAARNRNWLPHETPAILAFENMAHGLNSATTPEVGAARSDLVLEIPDVGDPRVVVLEQPVTIAAAEPRQIGG